MLWTEDRAHVWMKTTEDTCDAVDRGQSTRVDENDRAHVWMKTTEDTCDAVDRGQSTRVDENDRGNM